MIVIPASLRSDFIHMAGMTIQIALESTIHIVGIRTQEHLKWRDLGFLTIFTPYIRHSRLAAKSARNPSVPRQDSFLDMRPIAPTESSDKCFRIWRGERI